MKLSLPLFNRRLLWSPKITLPRFMDVLRTCLVIAVSSGAQSPKNRKLFLACSLRTKTKPSEEGASVA